MRATFHSIREGWAIDATVLMVKDASGAPHVEIDSGEIALTISRVNMDELCAAWLALRENGDKAKPTRKGRKR